MKALVLGVFAIYGQKLMDIAVVTRLVPACWVIYSHYLNMSRKPIFFSDNCGGQNKNIQIAAVCLYAVKNIDHLDEIVHTFLETGHTMMECDSMHAAVELQNAIGE